MTQTYPPFHLKGDPDGDFYALAFCEGTYVSPTGNTREDGFLVLYHSPSPEFTRLSIHTCTRDGRALSYSRGIDRHDTPEFALLKAWYEYRLPPHGWRLYPAEVARRHWEEAGEAHEESYRAMRKMFCSILYHLVLQAWSEQQWKVEPLFYPSAGQEMSDPFEPTRENEELFQSSFDGDEDTE
ncbi:MAG TPA: hypothetical protein VN256_27065 [Pyrinomonadaceae bacterium]|nr:hypothetical protein [Pyrinomonadaceae bacterium]